MASIESSFWLTVTCPKCGRQSLAEFPALVIYVALTRWNNLALYAACHEGAWDASPAELAQIRAQVGTAWLCAHQDLL